MTIQDTYKWGALHTDANNVINWLQEQGYLHGERQQIVDALQESRVDFEFDDDWNDGSLYQDDDQQTPLVLLGQFGGYPGETLDEANSEAAAEWAQDRDYIYSYSTWFGGCRTVNLYLNMDEATLEEAEEAIELAEGFREYPVLDEDLWSQKQSEAWDEMIDEQVASTENDKDIEFTDDQKDDIREQANEFYGYWEEGYFEADTWDGIIDKVLNNDVQLHQEDKLF